MFRKLMIAGASLAMLAAAAPSIAAPCHDAHGKFIKCPTKATTPAKAMPAKVTPPTKVAVPAKVATPAKAAMPAKAAAKHCRDAKGRFAKCGTPGAKPA